MAEKDENELEELQRQNEFYSKIDDKIKEIALQFEGMTPTQATHVLNGVKGYIDNKLILSIRS